MPEYTPPAGDAVNFSLEDYTPPAGDAVNFEVGEGALLSYTGQGGAVAGGEADLEFTRILEGTGGAVAGGEADTNIVQLLLAYEGGGGAIAGGAATYNDVFEYVAGGGAIAGGAADVRVFTAVRPGESTVTVYNPNGVQMGTLTPLHPYKIHRYENQVGDWEIALPLDQEVDYNGIPLAARIEYGWKVSVQQDHFSPENAPGEGFLLYQGVVEDIDYQISEGGAAALALRGSFRTYAMVRRSVLQNLEHSGSLAILTNTLAGTLLDPYGPVYDPVKLAGVHIAGTFTDLSRFAAWARGAALGRYVIRETWDHDRPQLVPYDGPPDSGITFRRLTDEEATDPDDRYAHDTGSTGVALISGTPSIKFEGTVVNRIIAKGVDTVADPEDPEGTVNDVLTLQWASLTSPYTVKAGVNPDGSLFYYIEDEDSIERYGLTELPLTFSEVKNPNDLTESRRRAANVLYMKAVNELIRLRSPKLVLTLQPIANGARIWALPGDSAMVEYHGEVETESGAAIWMDLDRRMLITERHEESHQSGIRRVGYVVAAPVMEFPVPGLPGEIVFPPDEPPGDDPSDPDAPGEEPCCDDPNDDENEGPDEEFEDNFPPIEAQCGRYGSNGIVIIAAGGASAGIPWHYKIDGDLDFGTVPTFSLALPSLGAGTWSVTVRVSLKKNPFLPDRTWTLLINGSPEASWSLTGDNPTNSEFTEEGFEITPVVGVELAGGTSAVSVAVSPNGFGGVHAGWKGDDYIQACFTPA